MKKILIALSMLVFSMSTVFAQEYLDRRIRIHNESHKRIVELYATPVDYAGYDYNMIRSKEDWILIGEMRLANIDDGTGYCRYNLRAVLADGSVAENFDVNVCELTDWYVY